MKTIKVRLMLMMVTLSFHQFTLADSGAFYSDDMKAKAKASLVLIQNGEDNRLDRFKTPNRKKIKIPASEKKFKIDYVSKKIYLNSAQERTGHGKVNFDTVVNQVISPIKEWVDGDDESTKNDQIRSYDNFRKGMQKKGSS